jgi:hypothetical protein
MKTILLTTAALVALALPAHASFEGSFGRDRFPACVHVIGNWIDAYDTCPMLGNGAGPRSASGDHVGEPPAPEPPKCEPKEPKEVKAI